MKEFFFVHFRQHTDNDSTIRQNHRFVQPPVRSRFSFRCERRREEIYYKERRRERKQKPRDAFSAIASFGRGKEVGNAAYTPYFTFYWAKKPPPSTSILSTIRYVLFAFGSSGYEYLYTAAAVQSNRPICLRRFASY